MFNLIYAFYIFEKLKILYEYIYIYIYALKLNIAYLSVIKTVMSV